MATLKTKTSKVNEKEIKMDDVKTFVLRNGDRFNVYKGSNVETFDILPCAVYRTNVGMFGDIYLTRADDFSINFKLYGDIEKRGHRIFETFKNRPKNTGVLLAGEKGSGKTLLAKYTANLALKEGIPTIIIDEDAANAKGFVPFMECITQECVIIFDEFEKMFEDSDSQNHLLSLFDGVSQNKKLFLLTVNESRKVNEFFKARPGRIFYNYVYTGVDETTIRQVCEDSGVGEELADAIVQHTEVVPTLNFDSMMAIIEEHLRYGEDFDTIKETLNIAKPTFEKHHITYTFSLISPELKNPVKLGDNFNLNDRGNNSITVTVSDIQSSKFFMEEAEYKKYVKLMSDYVDMENKEDYTEFGFDSRVILANTKQGAVYREQFRSCDSRPFAILVKKNDNESGWEYKYGGFDF